MAFLPVSWVALVVLAAVLLPGATSAMAGPSGPSWDELRSIQATSTSTPAFEAAPGRRAVSGDIPTPSLVASPAAGGPPVVSARTSLPASQPLFVRAQVVTLYGYPEIPAMGDLGKYTADEAAVEVARLAATYDALNGGRGAIGALHMVVAVAQPAPMGDGSYLNHLDHEVIARYAQAARRHGVLLILDTQLGMISPVEEARRLERFLVEPFVHLALDPEFAMRASGGVPGDVIGSVDSSEVNAVQAYLAALVRGRGLPEKLLLVHQFRDDMLTHSVAWAQAPEVLVTVNMDGWGDLATKLDSYSAFAFRGYAEYMGIKLFPGWDEPMLTPEQVLALPRLPDLVVYQ